MYGVCIHVCVYICIHTCIHTYAHTYTRTCPPYTQTVPSGGKIMLLGEASTNTPPVKSIPGVKTGSKGVLAQETKTPPQKGGVTLGGVAVMGAGGGMMAQLHAERLAREKEKADKERQEKELTQKQNEKMDVKSSGGKTLADGKDGGKTWWEEESEAGAKTGKAVQKKKQVSVGNAVKVSEG